MDPRKNESPDFHTERGWEYLADYSAPPDVIIDSVGEVSPAIDLNDLAETKEEVRGLLDVRAHPHDAGDTIPTRALKQKKSVNPPRATPGASSN